MGWLMFVSVMGSGDGKAIGDMANDILNRSGFMVAGHLKPTERV